MHEYWTNEADQMLDYINAAKVFGYQYEVTRTRGSRHWHIKIYTDALISRAQQAINEEE